MLLLVDNYDSFTYNLVDYFQQLNTSIEVQRNDVEDALLFNGKFKGVILSPGPGSPKEANKLMKIIEYYYLKVPILGICLGHQALGEFFGASLQKAIYPMHGKVSKINCSNNYLYSGLNKSIEVVRYHSLILEKLPSILEITSKTEQHEIMSFVHKKLPICGIQYHPEAYLTKYGIKILQNWLYFHKFVK